MEVFTIYDTNGDPYDAVLNNGIPLLNLKGIDLPIFSFQVHGITKNDEFWLKNGKWHRDPNQGPAHQWHGGIANGGDEEYYVNGKKHRDPNQGPAVQRDGGISNGGSESYYVKGKKHRDPNQGPAVQRDGGVANGGSEEYWVDGEFIEKDKL